MCSLVVEEKVYRNIYLFMNTGLKVNFGEQMLFLILIIIFLSFHFLSFALLLWIVWLQENPWYFLFSVEETTR